MARRHHCRRCGDIFCNQHSLRGVPLDQEARFHPDGNIDRACDNCWADYKTWRRARKSRANSVDESESATITGASSSQDAVAMGIDPDAKKPTMIDLAHARDVQVRTEDWNWSTF